MFSTYFKNNITICTLYDLIYLPHIPSILIQEGEYEFTNFDVNNYWFKNINNKKKKYDNLVVMPLSPSLCTTNTNKSSLPKKITTLFYIKKYLTEINNTYNPISCFDSEIINVDLDIQLKKIKNNFIVFFMYDIDNINICIDLISFGKKIKIGIYYIHEVIYKQQKIGIVVVSSLSGYDNSDNEKQLMLSIDVDKEINGLKKDVFGFGFINLKYIRALNIYPDINVTNICDNNTIAFIKYSSTEHKPKKFCLSQEEVCQKFIINNKKFNILKKNETTIYYRQYFYLMNKNLYKKIFNNKINSNQSGVIVSFDLFKDIYNINVIGKIRDEFTFQSKDIIKERNTIFSKTTNKKFSSVSLLNKNGQFIFVMLMPFSNYEDDYELYDEYNLNKTSIIYLNLVIHFEEIESRITRGKKYLKDFVNYLVLKEYKVLFKRETLTEHIYILSNKNNLDVFDVYDKNNINIGTKIVSNIS